MEAGLPAISCPKINEIIDDLKEFNLITLKPVIYVCNVDEKSILEGNKFTNDLSESIKEDIILISAEIESQISSLSSADQAEYLESLGLKQSGLNKIIKSGYQILSLITYFTSGEQETRAWTVTSGSKAPDAAGKIHTDFQSGFIRAETISYDDFVECDGEIKAKELGKMRSEGKEYVVQDGDVMHFLFNN